MYTIYYGTVQAYVVGEPNFFEKFGRPEYDSRKPIVSERERELVLPIIDDLNNNRITQDEAILQLRRV